MILEEQASDGTAIDFADQQHSVVAALVQPREHSEDELADDWRAQFEVNSYWRPLRVTTRRYGSIVRCGGKSVIIHHLTDGLRFATKTPPAAR